MCIHFKFRGFHDNSLSFTVLRRLNDECLNCNIKVNSPHMRVTTCAYFCKLFFSYSFLSRCVFWGTFIIWILLYTWIYFFMHSLRKKVVKFHFAKPKCVGQKWFNFHGHFHPILNMSITVWLIFFLTSLFLSLKNKKSKLH